MLLVVGSIFSGRALRVHMVMLATIFPKKEQKNIFKYLFAPMEMKNFRLFQNYKDRKHENKTQLQ